MRVDTPSPPPRGLLAKGRRGSTRVGGRGSCVELRGSNDSSKEDMRRGVVFASSVFHFLSLVVENVKDLVVSCVCGRPFDPLKFIETGGGK